MIGNTIGGYRIIGKIDEGGMGTVYLARYPDGGIFAIKALDNRLSCDRDFRKRFFREAKTLFTLKHANIVQARTFFEDKGGLFLVMEYVDCGNLHSHIQNRGSLPEKEALRIFKGALSGLNYAHMRGVVHRDIKPSNILLTRSGTPKIMDFGIALLPDGRRLTKTGMTMGTPEYMSPEQINPRRLGPIDHRSDVYSMGIVLYEMLTGSVPFEGDSTFEIYEKHINESPRDMRLFSENISNGLVILVKKALEKVPSRRYLGCGDFLEHVRAYETGRHFVPRLAPKSISMREFYENSKHSTEKTVFFLAIVVTLIILFILFVLPYE